MMERKRQRIRVEVLRVVDGDTLKVDIGGRIEKIRLLLIDALEVGSPNLLEHFLALRAKKFVSSLVQNAKKVIVKTCYRRDRFGRLLGHVFVDGRCLQELLVREGLARVAYVRKQTLTQEDWTWLGCFRRRQEEARQHRRGIWEYEHQNGRIAPQVKHVGN